MTDLSANSTRHPQLPEPLRSAVLHHEGGKLDAAYPLYRQFVADNPKNPTGLQLFGLLLSQLGQPEHAVRLMRESLELYPDQPDVCNNLGNALLKSGKLDEAIESYQTAIRLRPEYVDAYRNLALSYAQADMPEDALAALERCVALRPDDASAYFARANIRRDSGDVDGAIADFEKAVSLRPDFAEAHHNLGVILRLRQRPQDALEHYEAARKLGMDRAELHHNLGNALIDMQEADRAIDAFRKALAQNPVDLDTHKNLNSLLWQQEYHDDYLKSYAEALEQFPDLEPLRLAYGRALYQKQSWEAAEKVLREGLQYSGETAALKSTIAYTLEGQGRWNDALLLHESASRGKDALPNHLVSYGRALLACDRPDEALRQIQAGAALTPFNQRALAYLGLCWRMLDDERDQMLNDYENMVQAFDLPVPAGYANTEEFNRRLEDILNPLHFGKTYPAEQSLRGGSQTSGDLFDRLEPEITELATSLRQCIAAYIGTFPVNKEHPLYMRRGAGFDFSASWSVRLARSGFHQMHIHPLGWISSAYYVHVPKELAAGDEHGGGIKFGEPDIDIGEKGAARRQIQPSTGRLVLFPSYMWHGTVPFESDEPRMTVAFDVSPR